MADSARQAHNKDNHLSKSKNKTHSEIESLRGENRQLKKRLKQLERREHHFEHALDEVAEVIEVKDACMECGKGTIVTTDFGRFQVYKCDICDYKKVKK